MSEQSSAVWLFTGTATGLALASAVGWSLRRIVAKGQPHAVIDNLNARICAWWAMVAVLAIAAWLGSAAVVVLFALASFLALREFLTLTPTRRADHAALFVAFFAVLPAQYYLVGIAWYGMFSIFIPVYVFLGLPILIARGGDTTRFLGRIAEVQWGLMICVYCISHVPALLALPIPGFDGQNLLLVLFLLIVVQASDVGQYVWGTLLGRRPIAPTLSPSKTVEGLLGGGASALALGTALCGFTPFDAAAAAAISLLIVAVGFLGGLAMSAIKRGLGVKDWGTLIEGHGGVLDRLDSVCFAAPVFFHAVRYYYTI